jgi:hypothetical protein
MPYQDGTGPWGAGPASGRGLGPCRQGSGFRRRFTRKESLEMLKEEQKALEAELVAVKEEIANFKD